MFLDHFGSYAMDRAWQEMRIDCDLNLVRHLRGFQQFNCRIIKFSNFLSQRCF